ncbi:hypothetical protein G6F59_018946 [Rhizopus arrhizus]|nr:hypothetical protein G6F59_018946 [Rhizopus arrhizus]
MSVTPAAASVTACSRRRSTLPSTSITRSRQRASSAAPSLSSRTRVRPSSRRAATVTGAKNRRAAKCSAFQRPK